MTAKEIGEKIRNTIDSQGRTVKWVSQKLNLSSSSLSQRLSGDISFKYLEVEELKRILRLDENLEEIDQ